MPNQRLLPWLMWFFPLVFFGFQFILRLFPGLVMDNFLDKYQISATEFGFFASLYYFGYAGMQIPMAALLDKFGARKIISLSALLCGAATCLFILFDSWSIALASRFLIGVGSVVGFLGVSKVISVWFPTEKYTQLVGLTFSFGLLGAVYGGRPVSLMIAQMGWEKVSLILGGTAMLLGLLCFLFVRDKKVALSHKSSNMASPPFLVTLKKLLTHRSLLMLAFANFLMVGFLEGFADVWGVPYLMASRNLSNVDSASILSFIYIGMLFGGPLLAYLGEKCKSNHSVIMLSGLMMALLLTTLLYFNAYLPQWAVVCIMFSIGIFCCYQVIVFAIGAQLVPAHFMSLTIAFLNCINMLGGSFFHTLIGRMMDYFQQGSLGAGHYSIEAYTHTLAFIPLASLIGVGLVWLSKHQMKAIATQDKLKMAQNLG